MITGMPGWLLDLAEQLQAVHFIHPQIANHQIHFHQHAQRFRPSRR
jgi:hypothetical protein